MATPIYCDKGTGIDVVLMAGSSGPTLQVSVGREYRQLSVEEAEELAASILRGTAENSENRHVCPACGGPRSPRAERAGE